MPVAGIALGFDVIVGSRRRRSASSIGGLVERTDRAEDLPGARVDQIDAAEVPAGIAQMDVLETTIPGRDLEALTVETHRAVGAALLALDLDAEGIA